MNVKQITLTEFRRQFNADKLLEWAHLYDWVEIVMSGAPLVDDVVVCEIHGSGIGERLAELEKKSNDPLLP
jgi:hypothetical protein